MTVCRLCGMEIEKGGRRGDITNVWLSVEPSLSGFKYFCEVACRAFRIDVRSLSVHQPLIESVEEMLDALRSIEADLR